METIFVLVIFLVLAAATHYLAFTYREEYLFFSRRQARWLFPVFLFLLFVTIYFFVREKWDIIISLVGNIF